MSNPWFRMYSEFSHDPKVQMLSEAMQRRYVMLMCLRCSNSLVTLHDEEVAFHLRISSDELAETKALFIARGFIDAKWNLLNWEKRQFASDASKARVAKHRALQKEKQSNDSNGDVTLQKKSGNALDTDTDTDTDKSKEAQAPLPDWIPAEAWAGYVEMRKRIRKPMTQRAKKLVLSALAGMQAKGLSVAQALDNSTRNSWVDVYEPKEPAGAVGGLKRGTDEYAAIHKTADWWRDAGFESVWDADASKCWHDNAHQFREGKRAEVTA